MSAAEPPRLTGITSEAGECERCGRELGRVFEVLHPEGHAATYGRRCCAKVTGYRGNLEKAARVARRTAEIAERKATMAAAGFELAEVASTPEEWRGWEIVTSDHLWPVGWREALA